MRPAIRQQKDHHKWGDAASAASATYPGDEPDMARQEFAADADVNILLQRFGVNAQTRGQGTYTTVDYDLDLQEAMHVIRDVKAAHAQLPPKLHAEFPRWTDFLAAIERGDVKIHVGEDEPKGEPSAPPRTPPSNPNS